MQTTPTASYSLTLRVKLSSRAGTLGQLAIAIGQAGGDIGAIDIVSITNEFIIRDVTVNTASSEHGEKIVEAVNNIEGIEVVSRLRSHLPNAHRRQNRSSLQAASEDAR